MDETNKVTPEELAAEEAALKLPSEDEVRADIIAEYGFDETADKERIDKAVKKDIEGRVKLQKTIQQKIKHRTAAQEAAAKLKDGKPANEAGKKEELSQADLIVLIRSNIPEEDFGDVKDYAKLKGISIAEAIKAPVVKTILSQKKEERDVAEATATGSARRGSSKTSDDTLLKNAKEGKMPESQEDMERLIKLQKGIKD